jgi:aminoglycoside 3-N-acetyltransferase
MAELDQHRTTVTRQDIVHGLRQLGIEAGMDILAHSSLSSFGYVQGGADAVIDALIEAVGPQGTVLVPTLTGSEALSADNPPLFDRDTTPCWTGRIPQAFLQRCGAIRSQHPTHSVAAIGARAQALTKEHEFSITPCGPDSPYGRLAQTGGHILLLGVTHSVNTTFHHVEEIVGVPYHMQPGWVAAQVRTSDQVRTIHLMLHRYGPHRCFERMEPVFRERGIQRDGQIGQATVRLIDAHRMVEITRRALLQDPTILLAQPTTLSA